MATINIRNVDDTLARGIKSDAALRGLTLAGWLQASYDLTHRLRDYRGTGQIIIDADTLRALMGKDIVLSGTEYTALDDLLETQRV